MKTRNATNDGALVNRPPFSRGVPYHLPKTEVEVVIESIKEEEKHKELKVSVAPHYVADPAHRYVLRSETSAFFERQHKIDVEEGLLKTVTTTDDSKTADVVRLLAATALTLYTGVPVAVGESVAGDEEAVPTGNRVAGKYVPQDPTPKEQAAALAQVSPGSHRYRTSTGQSISRFLPGTGNKLLLTATPSGSSSQTGAGEFRSAGSVAAILTRTTVPMDVEVELEMRLIPLYKERLSALGKSSKAKSKEAADLKKEIDELQEKIDDPATGAAEKKKLVAQIKPKQKAWPKLLGEVAEIDAESTNLKDYTKKLEVGNKDPYFSIGQQTVSIAVTDDSSIFALSVRPASLGVTKHTVALDRGVVTSYDSQRPSVALELAKVPFDLANAIVAIPDQLLERDSTRATKAADVEKARLANEASRLDNETKRLDNEKKRLDNAAATP